MIAWLIISFAAGAMFREWIRWPYHTPKDHRPRLMLATPLLEEPPRPPGVPIPMPIPGDGIPRDGAYVKPPPTGMPGPGEKMSG
jgi:hypothetical protein